jgi:hypothetical protein
VESDRRDRLTFFLKLNLLNTLGNWGFLKNDHFQITFTEELIPFRSTLHSPTYLADPLSVAWFVQAK